MEKKRRIQINFKWTSSTSVYSDSLQNSSSSHGIRLARACWVNIYLFQAVYVGKYNVKRKNLPKKIAMFRSTMLCNFKKYMNKKIWKSKMYRIMTKLLQKNMLILFQLYAC